MKTLVVVAGPTAVGKTDLCVKLAQVLQTEILSADSRQFYRELNIGTAKPAQTDLKGVVHHFINSHSINELYSAGAFERDALQQLDALFKSKNVAIVTGGSGLYLKALCEGLDALPETPPELRAQLMDRLKNEGFTPLQDQLQALDSDYATRNDLQNSQRVVRALEVCLLTGRPFSVFRQQKTTQRPFAIVQIALERPREELYERIDKRMDSMLAQGLVAEAQSLTAYRHHNALQTVGYKEVFDHLDGLYDYAEMTRLLKRNSRRYAKRQMTWFKHQGNFSWFDATDFSGIMAFLNTKLAKD